MLANDDADALARAAGGDLRSAIGSLQMLLTGRVGVAARVVGGGGGGGGKRGGRGAGGRRGRERASSLGLCKGDKAFFIKVCC